MTWRLLSIVDRREVFPAARPMFSTVPVDGPRSSDAGDAARSRRRAQWRRWRWVRGWLRATAVTTRE
jgi:hypothetical protein